jgi:hypothetical protein
VNSLCTQARARAIIQQINLHQVTIIHQQPQFHKPPSLPCPSRQHSSHQSPTASQP